MWTRVLSWDEKWIYILTHFVKKDSVKPEEFTLYPEQNVGLKNSKAKSQVKDENHHSNGVDLNKAIVATALSRCVFKAGRRTISPMLMMKYSGLLPLDSIDEAVNASAEYYKSKDLFSCQHESSSRRTSSTESSFDDRSSFSADAGIGYDVVENTEESNLTEMEVIEMKRQRGMKAARLLSSTSQNALEMEFSGEDDPALGKHTDGAGIVGVVSTLAQLAGLKTAKVL